MLIHANILIHTFYFRRGIVRRKIKKNVYMIGHIMKKKEEIKIKG